jgi:hypothetical protein
LIRHIALLLNFLVPGTGSFLLGKWRVGLAQVAVLLLSLLAFANSFHTFFAVCAMVAVWFWGLYTAEWSPQHGGVASRKEV